jgi:2-polyprenyl-6-methoxyphenol hydroxylase-like FAD-dependent oxidoreductase
MTVAVVGAGPVGLFLSWVLAERGEDVVLVDPDTGPTEEGWHRRGVMQFDHPHFFRFHVRQALLDHAPALWDAVVAAGGVPNDPPPVLPPHAVTLACRRRVFERALRESVAGHPRVRVLPAYAEEVLTDGSRVTGLRTDAGTVDASLVVAAVGRSSSLGEQWRPEGASEPCGLSYVSRMYRARPGVEPLTGWVPSGGFYDGYQGIAFPQDDGTLSALLVRPSEDDRLAAMWRTEAYEAAVAAVPVLAPWTDPERFEPITPVMRGGTLTNSWRGQGTLPAGLFFVGDAVCTTNPAPGRGVTLGLWQAAALLDVLAEGGDAAAFDAWCEEHVKPWYDDQVANDRALVRRYLTGEWDGELVTDVYASATEADPSLMAHVGPVMAMLAPPTSLASAEPRVKELVAAGWQPGWTPGPSVDELVEVMASALTSGAPGEAAVDSRSYRGRTMSGWVVW